VVELTDLHVEDGLFWRAQDLLLLYEEEPGAGPPGRTRRGGARAAEPAALVVHRRSEHHPDPVSPEAAPTQTRGRTAQQIGRPSQKHGPDRLHLLARCRVDRIEPGIPPPAGTSVLRRSENSADHKQTEAPNAALPSITPAEETIVTTRTTHRRAPNSAAARTADDPAPPVGNPSWGQSRNHDAACGMPVRGHRARGGRGPCRCESPLLVGHRESFDTVSGINPAATAPSVVPARPATRVRGARRAGSGPGLSGTLRACWTTDCS